MREPVQRRKGEILRPDEFVSLLEAADRLDQRRHSERTLERAREIRRLREDKRLTWAEVTARTGISIGNAFYLYGCQEPLPDNGAVGPRRAIIATLGLAGLRVGELCHLDRRHVDLDHGQIHVREAKTNAGVRVVDIPARLQRELVSYRAREPRTDPEAPAFPTRPGGRRDRQNVSSLLGTVARAANDLRASRGESTIVTHITPHTLRRSYISFMLAAGYDVPYVQAQVGHEDPATTLGIYARVIAQPDRDRLERTMKELMRGAIESPSATDAPRLF
jgi:integrase